MFVLQRQPTVLYTLRVCCHSNETRALITNPPTSAQLKGISYHSPNLHPGPCSSVRMWRWTDRHTHRLPCSIYISPRLRLTRNVIIQISILQCYKAAYKHLLCVTKWHKWNTFLLLYTKGKKNRCAQLIQCLSYELCDFTIPVMELIRIAAKKKRSTENHVRTKCIRMLQIQLKKMEVVAQDR